MAPALYHAPMIPASRITDLNSRPVRPGKYILYWMQQSQRAQFNHALEYAIARANALRLPVVVCFGLTDRYPEANLRHYSFMFQGLRDVNESLRERGIAFIVRRGSPEQIALDLAADAAFLVCDRGYLRHQRRWRDHVADHAPCRVIQVETDIVVPVEAASSKQEFAARTLRPRIHRLVDEFLRPLRAVRPKQDSLSLRIRSDFNSDDPERILSGLRIDRSVEPSMRFRGGSREAHRLLDLFISQKLPVYASTRSEPSASGTSMLAPYLHFGQISPVEIALRVKQAAKPSGAADVFLEELIVRRELAINFVNFCPDYDTYDGVPAWARQTLAKHKRDRRPYTYSRKQLELARTHDPYWNAAQLEMTATGYMHNSMRMYWGKKIIEWKADPEEAFQDALYLNNRYFLCGRDPNAYANIAWLFGLHDRPWASRPIFGTVRYMNAAGLERKYDMQAYVDGVRKPAGR